MTAYLVVRAEVPETDRQAFDRWYENEHLPDAKAAFNALSASRGWSAENNGVHFAYYEFANLQQAKAVTSSTETKTMITEFDRVWQGRVTRNREIIEINQAI